MSALLELAKKDNQAIISTLGFYDSIDFLNKIDKKTYKLNVFFVDVGLSIDFETGFAVDSRQATAITNYNDLVNAKMPIHKANSNDLDLVNSTVKYNGYEYFIKSAIHDRTLDSIILTLIENKEIDLKAGL